MNLLGKSPVTIFREGWQTGRLIMDRARKTSGEEGDRRVGATAVAGVVVTGAALGVTAGINMVDFNKPEPRETMTLPGEVCDEYDRHATEILGRLAMDGGVAIAALPTAEGGTELSATVSEWGTDGTLTFLNPAAPVDPALTSPDLAVRGVAIDRFIHSPDSRFVNVHFDGNRALSAAAIVAGEQVQGEYYSDDVPVSVQAVEVGQPDGAGVDDCEVSSTAKSVREVGRAEDLPVDEALRVGLAVTSDLAATQARYI